MSAFHNRPMESPQFAHEFGQLYREVYRVAVRRVSDGREPLSPETTALLLHLAQAGPMSLSEMALHFDRALSTLSAKVAALEADGLLTRQRDDDDGRRATIWLSARGREVLADALDVLDRQRLSDAAERLSPEQRGRLIDGLRALMAALSPTPSPERSPMAHACESCGMPIDNGSYCTHCLDASGQLQDFETRFERMVQWALREEAGLPREAEQRTLAYMASMPAWAQHPRVQAHRAR